MSDEEEFGNGREANAYLAQTVSEAPLTLEGVAEAKSRLSERCKTAGLSFEEELLFDGTTFARMTMKCGRNFRSIILREGKNILELLSIPFEEYVFLPGYEAICSYSDGYIEASIRQLGAGLIPSTYLYRRLFGFRSDETFNLDSAKLVLDPAQDGLPQIELSKASELFVKLSPTGFRSRLTLKIIGCSVTTHDHSLALLKKTADAIFFQIDLLTHTAIGLERERERSVGSRRPITKASLKEDLQYPKTEYDEAPISLYWYARSASGMPLLQFLAFYQVIEFYFPIYSEAEAQRKLRGILKDPTFRGDRDTDIGKLLSAIHVSRSGAFGDERSQLQATLMECIDLKDLRDFLESNQERKQFYLSKGAGQSYHKLPLSSPTADLRNDVAHRIYNIRCKIVHSKDDSRDGEVKQLLPFSVEAKQLFFDIELAQYLAQQVLIAGSAQYQTNR